MFKEKINFKPPGSRADALHQDIQAGWQNYAKEFISILISVNKSDSSNANLIFDISGNNSNKIIGLIGKKLKKSNLIKPCFKSFPLNIGDVVVFNGFVPHMSSKNISNKKRTQIYLTYCCPGSKKIRKNYFAHKLLSYPPNNLRQKNQKYIYKV